MTADGVSPIPVVESSVFARIGHARFAVVEMGDQAISATTYANEFLGAAQLRANTYLEHGFVSREQLDDNGTELDRDDQRSAHFVVLERVESSGSMVRVVGNMRLVQKSPEDSSALPVESYFPELFLDNPLPINSVEVSRLIARHENPRTQRLLLWPLFVAGYRFVERNQFGPVHGLLSVALTRHLRSRRVPITPMASAKHIPEINATKQPVALDLDLLRDLVETGGGQDISLAGDWLSYVRPDDPAGGESH